jgi:hypothetical protein
MRVRGFHPFQPLAPNILDGTPFQDWILRGVFNHASGSFNRDSPPVGHRGNHDSRQSELRIQPTAESAGAASSGGHALVLNNDVVAEILAATRAMPSWRACVMEGTSWTGTAEENIEKYASLTGTQDKDT